MGFRSNYMDFLSCTCKNTAQHCAAAAGSWLTTPLALAGSRLRENVYMLSFKIQTPRRHRWLQCKEEGREFMRGATDLEKMLLDHQAPPSRDENMQK